jgi:hypothetical protein
VGGLLDQFRSCSDGDHVVSWLEAGQNRRIAPDDRARAVEPGTIEECEQETGTPRQGSVAKLSQELMLSIGLRRTGGSRKRQDVPLEMNRGGSHEREAHHR